jgi:hypothetical protein
MIFIPYFFNYTLDGKGKPCKESGYKACKSLEMARLSYIYIREFLDKDEHIYYSNGCSPFGTEYLTEFLDEPYEFIDENSYSYNPNIRVHIKEFKKFEPTVEGGVNRRIFDFLRFSYYNNLDYLGLDIDQLIGYNILDDFRGYDFGARHLVYNARSCGTCVVYISKARLKERDEYVKLPEFISHIESYKDETKVPHLALCGEGGYFRNFCYGRTGGLLYPDKIIHDEPKEKLIEFIQKNKVQHPFVDDFLARLEKNFSIK